MSIFFVIHLPLKEGVYYGRNYFRVELTKLGSKETQKRRELTVKMLAQDGRNCVYHENENHFQPEKWRGKEK